MICILLEYTFAHWLWTVIHLRANPNNKGHQVDRSNLLCMENPRFNQIVHNYDHLKGVSMADVDGKPQLPVHLILGAREYARIKTATKPRVGP